MKTDHISNRRKVGGDYFKLIFDRASNKPLSEYLDFNPNEYHILKCSNKQLLISYEQLLLFKYSSYILFRKDLYDINNIFNWCDYIHNFDKTNPKYLVKPSPPFNCNKIIIKQ
jgi:hypothetical protein